jgi:hypothetical protein
MTKQYSKPEVIQLGNVIEKTLRVFPAGPKDSFFRRRYK